MDLKGLPTFPNYPVPLYFLSRLYTSPAAQTLNTFSTPSSLSMAP